MFRTVPLFIIGSFSLRIQQTCVTYTIAVCTVKKHDEQRKCPKHVEFYSKNKFEKLVHIVGFIIRILYNLSKEVSVSLTWPLLCLCKSWAFIICLIIFLY